MMITSRKGCLCGAASVTAILALLASAGTAHASGFQVRETSGTLQGSSYAGMSTLSTDASTIFYNPANVGHFDETSYSAGGALIIPRSTMSNGSATTGTLTAGRNVSRTDYGDFAQDAFVPNAHAVWKLTDQLNIGISMTSPWGLVTDYEPDFSGRFFGTTSAIKTVNIKPLVAYRFDNGLSLGAGAQIQHMDARLARSVAFPGQGEGNSDVTGDDLAAGWTAGANWEFMPGTRIGAAYNSTITHNLEGDIKFDTGAQAAGYRNQTATAKVSTPEAVTFGIAQDIGEKWTVMADAQWTNWNSIDTLDFHFGGDTNILIAGTQNFSSDEYKWGSAWFYSLGARYQHDDRWAFTGGVAFDETPVKDKYRSVRLPDSNRYWVSLGTTYKAADWADVSLGYTHIFAHSADINLNSSTVGTYSGTYESEVDIIALQANFKF
ncbi:OmpP1/FadL family transporter [Thalassospira sp.]|uniref:OmpP1/FadL family transporter n=1 Tax=Thalassospira sp. TaxID=1912094 RepID=UPI002736371D|nr:outer membrane protein transport protein [Thalassospira sp.]MDP2699109.1 outer membrane protein transport protein [Thalassospira sp.]